LKKILCESKGERTKVLLMFLLLLFFIFYFFALKHVLHRLENATVLQLTETKPQFKEETSAPYLLANSSTQANTVKL